MVPAAIFGTLLPGLPVTLELTAISTVLMLAMAAALAIGRNSMRRSIVRFTRSYVDIFRSIPTLALLYLVFFGLGGVARTLILPAFWAAVLALTLSQAAFSAEVFTSAIRSVGPGQWDAAASIGMTRRQTYGRVVLPQAVVPAIAPTVNGLIWVIKTTALASLITVNELTLRADTLINVNAEPFKTYIALLAFYVAITVPLGYLGRYSERRVGSALGAGARLR